MIKSYANIAAYLTLSFTTAILLYGAYLLLWPYPKPVNNQNPIHIQSDTVRVGEAIILSIDVCYPRDEQMIVYRKLHRIENEISHRIYNLPEIQVNIKKGCYKANTATNIIPENAIPGRYYLEFTSVIQVNPLRKAEVNYVTEQFEVIK